MATPDSEHLRHVFDRVERHIEDRWGVPVHIQDVPNPFTGDLDGEQIIVDYDLEIEDAVFILIHLFGHTVQWNVSQRARDIGLAKVGSQVYTEELLREIGAYEKEACAYSLQLLHDCKVTDLDQWVSDFAACDSAYLMHLYRTGEKRPFRSFWQDNAPLVPPRLIPEFQPTRWISRYDGTVV